MDNPMPLPDAPTPAGMTPRRRLYWTCVSVLWGLCAFWAYAPIPAAWIESYYSRGLYRVNVALMTPLTSLYPNSLALIIVALILLGLPAAWIAWWVHGRRRRGLPHLRAMGVAFRTLMVLVPVIVLWFTLLWGAGYRRVPAEIRLDLDTAAIADTEAAEIRAAMLEVIMRDLPAPEDRAVGRAVAAIAEAMRAVVVAWDGRAVTLPARVKATPPGLLLANGTSGMAVPLTLEPHVDGGLPDTAFVQTAAHELGHVAGINVEAEATLIGYVAGLQADDAYARYAVALDVYTDLARQLPREEHAAALDLLPQEARDDLQAARESVARYRIDWYRNYSWRVYDKYLQSQGIAEGRKNYSKGITLFTYAWRKGLVKPAGDTPEIAARASGVG